jgi:hypothetical protein
MCSCRLHQRFEALHYTKDSPRVFKYSTYDAPNGPMTARRDSLINEMLLPRLIDGIACDMLLNPVTVGEELICLRGRPSSTIRDTNS